jgi:energy-coupling factor transporter ATP-binding protein EcfA2
MESNKKGFSNIDPETLLTWATSHKKLKESSSSTPIDGYELHDIKVATKHNEDDIFLQDDEIYFRIRRGNAIATVLKGNKLTYKIARRGIIKFFDYQSKTSKKHKLMQRLINPIHMAFKCGNKIRIYYTEKANGENLQISFDNEFNAWIIGSKNVTIVVRDQNDIDWYKTQAEPRDRYRYAVEFAELWFQILNEKVIKTGLYSDLLKEITGYTLCGENVGDLAHQHIKLYKEKDIVFFGMVANQGEEICEPITKVTEVLSKYGLSVVNFTASPDLESFEEFDKYMIEQYNKVLVSDVEKNGEGQVAYFSAISGNNEKIVSVAKLKTFEYKFLRMIREKIKFNKHELDVAKAMKDLTKESNKILKEEGDNLDLAGYLKFGEFLMNIVKKMPGLEKKLPDVYAQFIYEVKALYNKTEGDVGKVTYNDIKELISLVNKENFEDHDDSKMIIDSEINEMNSFKKKKEKKVNLIQEDDIEMSPEYYEELKKEKDKIYDYEIGSFSKLKKGKTYAVIILGLVGSGKTTIIQYLQDIIKEQYSDSVNLDIVSSDYIHRKYIDEYLEKHPKKSFEEALKNTRSCTQSRFEDLVNKAFDKFKEEDEKVSFIILDKNFPINAAESQITTLLKRGIQTVVFYPRIYNTFKTTVEYPFSLNFIIQCYYRLKTRKDHETLDFDINPHAHYILLSFLTLYRNSELKVNNAHTFPLTMTDEDDFIALSRGTSKKFEKLLKNLKEFRFEIAKIKNKYESDIKELFNHIENNFTPEMFKDKRDVLKNELESFFSKTIK